MFNSSSNQNILSSNKYGFGINGSGKKYFMYSKTWANKYLFTTTTILDSRFPHFKNKGTSDQRPLVNTGHYFWVPSMVVVHKFDSTKIGPVKIYLPASSGYIRSVNPGRWGLRTWPHPHPEPETSSGPRAGCFVTREPDWSISPWLIVDAQKI